MATMVHWEVMFLLAEGEVVANMVHWEAGYHGLHGCHGDLPVHLMADGVPGVNKEEMKSQ